MQSRSATERRVELCLSRQPPQPSIVSVSTGSRTIANKQRDRDTQSDSLRQIQRQRQKERESGAESQKDRETTHSSCRMEGVFGAPGSWQLALLTTTCPSQDSVDEVSDVHTLYPSICPSNRLSRFSVCIHIYIYYTHTKPPVYARHSYTMRYQNARLTLIMEENTVLSVWMWIVFGKSRSGARQCKVGCVQAEALSTQGRSSS